MVMIETFLGMAKYLSSRGDDDWADRLHYLITPNLLLGQKEDSKFFLSHREL